MNNKGKERVGIMKTARTYTAVLAFISIVVTVGQLAAQETVKQPFSITISALKLSYKAGSSVELKVVMTNMSGREIDAGAVYDRSINATYEYDVRDSLGNPAPRKDFKPSELQTVRMRTLKPGESVSDVTNVARWVDFSRPGEYQIQVSRNIGDDEKDGVVKSNTITITVLPADGTPSADEPPPAQP